MTLIAYNSARHEDLRDVVSKVVQESGLRRLERFLKQNMAVDDTNHKWVNKPLKGYKTTLASAYTSGATSLTLATGTGVKMRIIPGQTYAKIDNEIFLVGSQSTDTLGVTGAQRSSTAANHDAGAEIIFFQHLHEEGADNSRDDSQTGTKTTNYTQIIRRELKLSGTSQAVNSVGNDNAWSNQVQELLPEMLTELFNSAIHSKSSVDGDESLRAMGGLMGFVSNQKDASSNALSKTIIDNYIITLLENGVDPENIGIMAPSRQIARINDLKVARVTGGGMGQGETILRQNVDQYEFSDANAEIFRCPLLANNEMYVFDKTRFSIHPLKGRAFKVEDIGKVGDSVQKLLIGEYTCEVKNADEAFIRVYNLAL